MLCSKDESGINEEKLHQYLETISSVKVHLFSVFSKYVTKLGMFPQARIDKASRILEEAERRLSKRGKEGVENTAQK